MGIMSSIFYYYKKVNNELSWFRNEIEYQRFDYTILITHKHFGIRNQFYIDLDDKFNQQKYFDKLTVSYKFNDNVVPIFDTVLETIILLDIRLMMIMFMIAIFNML